MKKILLLIAIITLVGCTNNIQNDVNNRVQKLTYIENYEYLNNLINELKMFPTQELEEEYIYYVLALKNNLSLYSKEEIKDLVEIMTFEYKFGLNKLKYTKKDYQDDLNKLKAYYE